MPNTPNSVGTEKRNQESSKPIRKSKTQSSEVIKEVVKPQRKVIKNDEEAEEFMNEYDKIADLDDLEITPWQRQMRVNKFMLEVGIRKKIS